jgi:N-acetylneuraminic acid mutarotase
MQRDKKRGLWPLLLFTTLLIGGCGVIEDQLYPVGSLTVHVTWPNGITSPQAQSLVFTLSGENMNPKTAYFSVEKSSIEIENVKIGAKTLAIVALDDQRSKNHFGSAQIHIEKEIHSTVSVRLRPSWTNMTTINAPAARTRHAAIWTGSKMVVWAGQGRDPDNNVIYLNDGGLYDPVTNHWTAMDPTNAPTARTYPAAVWTGSKMIVWGGEGNGDVRFNDGGVYDPQNNQWAPMDMTEAPTARGRHTAVWTGNQMIVWGGHNTDTSGTTTYFNDGGIYDPAANRWKRISSAKDITERHIHTAIWTGTQMIVWGGGGANGLAKAGGIYDPATDIWSIIPYEGGPTARNHHTAIWTQKRMIIWGGSNSEALNIGEGYDPIALNWTPVTTTLVPTATSYHTAVWTDSKMIVWGGKGNDSLLGTGGIYSPATDVWERVTTTNAPIARYRHTAVWADSKMMIWGGEGKDSNNANISFNNGGVYEP